MDTIWDVGSLSKGFIVYRADGRVCQQVATTLKIVYDEVVT
jgi:hypothetical protein